MSLSPNTMLGPYRVVSLIGEGGMGAVYRANDTRLKRDVAIKVLTGVTVGDTERLQRFEQEARATGMLNHPNLLTIYDVGEFEGAPFLVSELLEGETLRERLTRGSLSVRKAVDAALQMAQGLAAAHEKGIVHRDLKPDNVFLTRDGRLKILDFGIAKLTTRGASDGPTFQMAATEPGMVLGTVGYMSPEQVRGEPVDHRSDLFSFGAIVYEMLTGARAFKRDSSIETLSAILKEDPPDLIDVLPNLPPALDRLVRRCLEKDRDARFQSARDLAFNLETLSTVSMPGSVNSMAHAAVGPNAPTVRTPPPLAKTSTMAQPPATHKTSGTMRPHTVSMKPKRRVVSPVLLALLYIVSIAGAAFAGWWWAHRGSEEKPEVAFHRVTFRRGEIRGARFTPDGETIVYSAAWDGLAPEVFVATMQAPEARPLGIEDAEIVGVSKSTELAVLLHRDRLTGLGTLARVPLAGGKPREVATDVLQADWSPDGANLAIIRLANGQYRLEYPIGRERYTTPHAIHDVRVSPDGSRLAFVEPITGVNHVAVITGDGQPESIAQGWNRGATGLAWSADGKEIWLTGTATAAPPSLYAIGLDGESRLVSRLTGSMKLFDLSAAGRVLLSNGMWRSAIAWGSVQPDGTTQEREASWLDWSTLSDLSPDGKTMLFSETREGGGAKNAVFLRRADEPLPMRIGDGIGDALAPDGHWVLSHTSASKLFILPTGPGEARDLKIEGNFENGGAWFPDSKRVVVGGVVKGAKGYQLHIIDTLDETAKTITPENIWSGGTRAYAVSPDSRFVAGMTANETLALYPTDGSLQAVPVAAAEKGEVPITFSGDGAALYVYRPTTLPARVFRIDLATGARTLWKEFVPADPAGVYKIAPVLVTPDGSTYAYNALRNLSDLYVAEGLR